MQRRPAVRTLILILIAVFYNPAMRILIVAAIVLAFSDSNSHWQIETSGVEANLRGISVQRSGGKYAIWASGTRGTILRGIGEGPLKQLKIEGTSDLDFRDIEAFGENIAYLMSSGDGDKSRIYKTGDGGKSWTLQYSDQRAGFFLDSLACESRTQCVALSDPVGGKFLILASDDGLHWTELPRDKMPAALPGEGAFAASGTAIAVCENGIYFGTGGPAARVWHSADRGLSWTVVETPVASGNVSSGIFSITCRGHVLIAVGGDYRDPDNARRVAAYSTDSGSTWHLADQQPGGYRSAAVFVTDRELVAVGTNGTDISHDAGLHWQHADAMNMNAVSFSGRRGWAVGPKGAIAGFRDKH